MKTAYITAIAVFLALAAGAQQPLSLEQCRQEALQHNAAVRIGREKVEASGYLRKQAFTKYFPEAAAGGLFFHTNKDVFKLGFLDNIVTVSFLDKGRSASIAAVQPVFMGGQIVNGNKLAKVGEEASKIELEQTRSKVVATTDTYFWNIAALQSKLGTLKAALTYVDSLEVQVRVALKAGLITANDLLEVQIKRNQLVADSIDLENGILLSRRLLGQYIGRHPDDVVIDSRIDTDSLPVMPDGIYRDAAEALPSTTQYRLLEKNVEAKRLETRIATGKNLPSITVGAGYFYDRLLGENNGFGAVCVTATIPITAWWGGAYDIKRTQSARRQAEVERDNYGELLKIGMDNAWDDLTSSYRKAYVAHSSIAAALENLRIRRAEYDAGTTTITDLLQAEALYRGSRDAYIEACAEMQKCIADYREATGQQ